MFAVLELERPITDLDEAAALNYHLQNVSITVATARDLLIIGNLWKVQTIASRR